LVGWGGLGGGFWCPSVDCELASHRELRSGGIFASKRRRKGSVLPILKKRLPQKESCQQQELTPKNRKGQGGESPLHCFREKKKKKKKKKRAGTHWGGQKATENKRSSYSYVVKGEAAGCKEVSGSFRRVTWKLNQRGGGAQGRRGRFLFGRP